MYSIKYYLFDRIQQFLNDQKLSSKGVEVSRSPLKGFDYATNILFIHKNIDPHSLVDFFKSMQIVKDVQINKGFINIALDRLNSVNLIFDSYLRDYWKSYDMGKGKRVLIEFVSANPTGPLNAVNGRSASFGFTLANVLKYFNYEVYKEYYVNDVGEQIEKLIDSFVERIKEARGIEFRIPEGGYTGAYLKDLANYYLKLYNGQNDFNRYQLKEFLVNYFVDSHKKTLERFGVIFDNWFFQSQLKEIETTIQWLKDKDLMYEKDGALFFRSTIFGDDKDRVVKKTVGRVEYTYFAYDIEYIRNKINRGFDEIITILGPDHHGYVNRLIAATKAINDRFNHRVIILQIVNILEKDKALKMSKRKGILVLLDELMDKVNPFFLRYFFLSRLKDSPLDLDLELINKLTLDNPLYYVFYVYARICGVIRNYTGSLPQMEEIFSLNVDITDDEFELFLVTQEFRDAVLSGMNDPYYLTLWASNFAKIFHRFYNSNKIICSNELGKDREKLRMILILFSKGVLEIWANLLNIQLPEKM
ncbi:MAG: arginine--tRNA ligase [bacterium]